MIVKRRPRVTNSKNLNDDLIIKNHVSRKHLIFLIKATIKLSMIVGVAEIFQILKCVKYNLVIIISLFSCESLQYKELKNKYKEIYFQKIKVPQSNRIP